MLPIDDRALYVDLISNDGRVRKAMYSCHQLLTYEHISFIKDVYLALNVNTYCMLYVLALIVLCIV